MLSPKVNCLGWPEISFPGCDYLQPLCFLQDIAFKMVQVTEHQMYLLAVFCCVGALAITGSLHHIDRDLLGWWLCERQCKDGGLNGRPEKLADVRFTMFIMYSCVCFAFLNTHCFGFNLTVKNFSRFATHGGCYQA